VTFLFAGLQKLANPQFLSDSSPVSIHAQLVGAARSSPIHSLVTHLVPVAQAVGVVIAVGEVAIGLGVVVGLWIRAAAVAGMILSFGLFLTVSFHSSPYFTGSDIVFFFAWTPLVLAGAAGAPAIDTWRTKTATAASDRGRHTTSRRTVLSGAVIGGAAAAVVLVGAGMAAGLGRLVGRTSATASGGSTDLTPAAPTTAPVGTAPTTTGPAGTAAPTTAPSGTAIGPSSAVPVGGSAAFTDPATGDPSLVLQPSKDDFVAFDAVCPHAGCTVAYQPSAGIIACPCHGSEFSARTGEVLRGPAATGLTPIAIREAGDGKLYVTE
jgi:thiosulfate dehydrogenase [quinone] large subunit